MNHPSKSEYQSSLWKRIIINCEMAVSLGFWSISTLWGTTSETIMLREWKLYDVKMTLEQLSFRLIDAEVNITLLYSQPDVAQCITTHSSEQPHVGSLHSYFEWETEICYVFLQLLQKRKEKAHSLKSFVFRELLKQIQIKQTFLVSW